MRLSSFTMVIFHLEHKIAQYIRAGGSLVFFSKVYIGLFSKDKPLTTTLFLLFQHYKLILQIQNNYLVNNYIVCSQY